MSEQTGTFYAVSVGPGDPELLTLQAVRVLENTPVIGTDRRKTGRDGCHTIITGCSDCHILALTCGLERKGGRVG